MKPENPDVMAALLAPFKDRKPAGRDFENLVSDSQLIIIAGRCVPPTHKISHTTTDAHNSDTTSATVTNTLMELCRHPENIEKLRQETAPYVDAEGHVSNTDLANLDHLNAVINETLRMHPPVPLDMLRLTPPEGLEIGDVHVPGNITVSCPQYIIGRHPEAYQRPNEFLPERWYSQPDLVKYKQAFAPFSIGNYNCIGKPLAMMNMRITLMEMVHRFDIGFAPGEDGKCVDENSIEHVVMVPPELKLSFRPR